MTNPIKSFFLFCSGATSTILEMKGCEVEHTKYAGIGVTIFFTAVLATLSGGYAMFTVFHNNALSFAFGLFWGLIIFNLDRFIVSSIRKNSVAANATLADRFMLKAGEILKALPRLILAIFISIIITRPLELKLFEAEIQGQLATDLAKDRTKMEETINVEYADITKSEEETEKLRNRLIELQNEWNRRVKVASSELEGWGGTKNAGDGPEYKKRQAEAKQAEAELNAFRTQYAQLIQAREQQINERKAERDKKAEEAKNKIDKSGGLLKRLEALSTLTTEHLSVLLASGFIILLFISLETAPIIVKLFARRGPYDDYLDAIEHQVYATQQKNISDINDDVNTSVALSKQINAGRLQAELQMSQNTMASLHTLAPQDFQDAQVEIAKKAIARWKLSQLNRLNYVTPPVPHTGQPAMPTIQSASPHSTVWPPQNITQPSGRARVTTPTGASNAAAPASSPSNSSGGTHTSAGAATAGTQPSTPAATQHGSSSSAQQTFSATGQQSSPSVTQAPTSSNGNPPTP